MKKAAGILASAVLALVALPAQADFKIGFVNGQRVMNEAAMAKKAQQKVQKEFEKRDQALQEMSKRLQSMQSDLEKNSVTMSESDRGARSREFNELNREFQRRQREFREDWNVRNNEEMAIILDRSNKVIKQIAESEKIDLIVQEAVYFSPRIDITDKVIKALGDGGK